MNIKQKLEKIITSNITDIPYEGKEIDVENIVNETSVFLDGIMKGFGTYILQNYTITTNGWQNIKTEIIKPRSEIIKEFLIKI